ncbi:uncharacterized protein F5Z01DRAFT_675533 [Emericellopsis atlantica]|uniref:DUF967 domain protein n=1 Tax=Emericellopsis atlantica TaxID=2614577 RepID=A0A9P7ZJA1_9HYPO|nr:uncharacterized protein F5Z01DRAFT_675533 [Emericellopsis atlantica]KAG9253148.1 hypothetical protein F5Z01DRAFT_675533 [Emericellopsis atlantica]
MSTQTLHRLNPVGHGLEAALVASRKTPEPAKITLPPKKLDELTAAGDSFTFDAFTTQDAHELGHLLYARLAPHPRPVLINITLASGLTVFQTTTGPGIHRDNENWVARKRNTVFRWGAATYAMHLKFEGNEAAFASKFMLGDEAGQYAIHGGAIPIRVANVEGIVAVVIVSGLAQAEDHGVIVDVVKENWGPVEEK